MQDPVADVATDVGDINVPVDVRNFGRWLKLFFGAPVEAAGTGGEYVHTFTSGAAALPSMSVEIGAPEVPAYTVNRGCRGNQLKIGLSHSGLLSATCSLIAIGETDPVGATVAGNAPTALAVQRFAQASGYVKKDGAQLGSVVSADFTFSNNLEPINTIQPDGRIEDSDPGQCFMSGNISIRYKDTVMQSAASAGTPMELDFGWAAGLHGLVFAVPRVFLPKPKRSITGPKGIVAAYSWQASGKLAPSVTAVLTNDVQSYA